MTALEATLSCPRCGKSLSVLFADIAPGKHHVCDGCGEVITFAGADASKVQQMIDALGAKLPGVSVNVNVKVKTRRPWWKLWGA